MMASFSGHTETAEVLLAHGADINANEGGRTALLMAVRGGHVELVKLLLRKGGRVTIGDGDRSSVLGRAQEIGDENLIGLLKQAIARESNE